ncbi:acyl carrier protein, partial [Streptomyces sp. f51]
AEDGRLPPRTPTELRIAAAWSTALGVPRDGIGRHDDFFDRGGTSLAAVKVAIALDRAISPKDLTRCPVLADLAALLDLRRAEAGSRPAERPAHA